MYEGIGPFYETMGPSGGQLASVFSGSISIPVMPIVDPRYLVQIALSFDFLKSNLSSCLSDSRESGQSQGPAPALYVPPRSQTIDHNSVDLCGAEIIQIGSQTEYHSSTAGEQTVLAPSSCGYQGPSFEFALTSCARSPVAKSVMFSLKISGIADSFSARSTFSVVIRP